MIAITASLDKQTGVTPIDDEWVLGDIHDIIVILVEYACASSVATIARVGGYAGTSVGIYIGLIVVRFVGDADGVLIDSVGAIVRFAVGGQTRGLSWSQTDDLTLGLSLSSVESLVLGASSGRMQ